MQEKMKEQKSSSLTLKLIIVISILCVVAGLWYVKQNEEKEGENNSNRSAEVEWSNDADFELHVTDELDIEQLKTYGLPIIIDFGADSCIPCKEMAPVLEQLNEELRGKAIIKFVDVWKYQELAQDYPIRVIPTQVFFDKDGNPFNPSDPEAAQMNMYVIEETNEHVFTTHEGGMTEEMLLGVLKELGMEE